MRIGFPNATAAQSPVGGSGPMRRSGGGPPSTDDAAFAAATGALKQQAAALEAAEDRIKRIVADVGLAAKIVGGLAQAAAFLLKL